MGSEEVRQTSPVDSVYYIFLRSLHLFRFRSPGALPYVRSQGIGVELANGCAAM